MDGKVLQEEDLNDKVAVVVGTRPGIIKMSPLVKELEKKEVANILIHAGQHYSQNLDDTFFTDLKLDSPDYRLEQTKECEYHGEQTAEMLEGIEQILLKERPRVVLVCGDANYNLAGALAARKLGMIVGHVESGLRSEDWRMPEEHNRVIIDHISEHLFAPTEEAKQNAIEDNVKGEIHITGNTIVDAVYENKEIAAEESNILSELGVEPNEFFLVTAHREENVDNKEKLELLIETLEQIHNSYNKETIFSIHPRTVKMLERFGHKERLITIDSLHIIEPVGYLDFLQLEANAFMILTDSGGIQEEACILQVPCVTLRENTERPETVEIGANQIAGVEPNSVLGCIDEMSSVDREWQNPFGDGTAAKTIINIAVSTFTNTQYDNINSSAREI